MLSSSVYAVFMDASSAIETKELAPTHGKRLLLDAALRLAARNGDGLASLGLRELAREADLNANTFYRHFHDIEDLAKTAVEELAAQIMAGMHEVRRKAAQHADATTGAVQYFIEFVRRNQEAFIVGVREVHSAHSPMRRILQKVLDQIAAQSVEQILEQNLVPGLSREQLLQATTAITYHMFYRALDVIERPAQRRQIAEQIIQVIRMIFLGALKG